jgi:tetratricopeptide (TPR) repeat protein
MKYNSGDLALLAASNLAEHCAQSHKSLRAITQFQNWSKKADSIKNTDGLKKFNDTLLPAWDKAKISPALASKNMSYAHELLKVEKINAKVAIEALSLDPNNGWNVYIAENTHRRFVKMGDTANAETYFKKAQAIYPYSTYFDGAKKGV